MGDCQVNGCQVNGYQVDIRSFLPQNILPVNQMLNSSFLSKHVNLASIKIPEENYRQNTNKRLINK